LDQERSLAVAQYRTLFVVIEDATEPTPAMRRAVALARLSGARLHLCMLLAPVAVDAIGYVSETVRDLTRAAMLSRRRDWLQEYAQRLHEQGIEATVEVLWQEPDGENLILRALEQAPDLMIKDAQRRPPAHLPFLPTTDQKLLCNCPYPLMLVSSHAPDLPARVVAAVDPVRPQHTARHLNERVLRAALEISLQADARVEVVSVVDPPAPDRGDREAALSTRQFRELHRQRLQMLLAAQRVPPECSVTLHGEPASRLASHLRQSRADLLVLGTLYRGGVDSWLLGSTAKQLARECPCDLLAIKPQGFDQDFVAVHGFHALVESPPDPNLDAVLHRQSGD